MSKQIVTAIVLGVAGVLLALLYRGSDTSHLQPHTATTTADAHAQFYTDTDGDGLKDWEETLLGLDPKRTDTDGNGISDYDEINTADNAIRAYATQASGTTTEAVHTTDLLARELFGAYLQTKSLETYDTESFSNFIYGMTQNVFTDETESYTRDDIAIVADDTTTPHAYVASLGDAVAPLATIAEYELTLYARAVESGAPSAFAQLRDAADAYTLATHHLLAMQVPVSFADDHVALVNGFAHMATTLAQMAASEQDPIWSFVIVRSFTDAEDMIKSAYTAIDIFVTLYDE